MDTVKCSFIIVRDYPTLLRVFSVPLYHHKNTGYLMRKMKRVYYLKHTLDMEWVYEELKSY